MRKNNTPPGGRELQSYIVSGAAGFSENRFNTFAIQLFINYLRDETARAGERTLLNAFSIAAYIEYSLMERHYFEIAQGDSEELKRTLNNLAGATQSHVKHVKDTLETYKQAAKQG
jgi:hypothetical protein